MIQVADDRELTTDDLVERYNSSYPTICRWHKYNQLPPAIKTQGKRRYWLESVLDEWDERCAQKERNEQVKRREAEVKRAEAATVTMRPPSGAILLIRRLTFHGFTFDVGTRILNLSPVSRMTLIDDKSAIPI